MAYTCSLCRCARRRRAAIARRSRCGTPQRTHGPRRRRNGPARRAAGADVGPGKGSGYRGSRRRRAGAADGTGGTNLTRPSPRGPPPRGWWRRCPRRRRRRRLSRLPRNPREKRRGAALRPPAPWPALRGAVAAAAGVLPGLPARRRPRAGVERRRGRRRRRDVVLDFPCVVSFAWRRPKFDARAVRLLGLPWFFELLPRDPLARRAELPSSKRCLRWTSSSKSGQVGCPGWRPRIRSGACVVVALAGGPARWPATAPEVVHGVVTEQPGANAGTRGSTAGRVPRALERETRRPTAMPRQIRDAATTSSQTSPSLSSSTSSCGKKALQAAFSMRSCQWKEGDPYYGTFGWPMRRFSVGARLLAGFRRRVTLRPHTLARWSRPTTTTRRWSLDWRIFCGVVLLPWTLRKIDMRCFVGIFAFELLRQLTGAPPTTIVSASASRNDFATLVASCLSWFCTCGNFHSLQAAINTREIMAVYRPRRGRQEARGEDQGEGFGPESQDVGRSTPRAARDRAPSTCWNVYTGPRQATTRKLSTCWSKRDADYSAAPYMSFGLLSSVHTSS